MSVQAPARLQRIEAGGFRWWVRPEHPCDLSAIREVVERRAYFTRDFRPEPGERWLDAGASIGVFAVLVAAAGAEVIAYEPTPESADLARRNLSENGLQARVLERAVALHSGFGRLGLAKAPWRNSLLRSGGEGYAVPVVSFAEAIADRDAAKLDIEGAEIAILLDARDFGRLHKLVFEWHFDHERRTDVYLAALDRLREHFEVRGRVVEPHTRYEWYPPAAIVRCWR
jgi:FkbM family methyltransferase